MLNPKPFLLAGLPFLATRLSARAANLTSLSLAEIPPELRAAFATVLGVIMMVAFIKGVIDVISGASKLRNGDPEGKLALVGGALTAGGAMIMGAFYAIFGLSDGILHPTF